jgi:hypothetical protein
MPANGGGPGQAPPPPGSPSDPPPGNGDGSGPAPDEEDEDEGAERVRPGDRNPDLGDIYETILYQDDDAVIYLNEQGDLRMSYRSGTKFPAGIGAFEADAVALQHQPIDALTPEQRRCFMRLIGRAWVIILEGAASDTERIASATRLLTQAAAYRTARLAELSREWFLTAGAGQLLFLWVVGFVLWVVHDGIGQICGPGAPLFINAFVMGATGAMVSVCLRLESAAIDPASGPWRHRVEIAGRLFVGGMTALAACLLFRVGQITIGPTGGSPDLAALVIALFAGASERLFPSLGPKLTPAKG